MPRAGVPAPVVSAEIVTGKKTNRVKRTRSSTETSPQRGLIRYRRDPAVRNLAHTTICVSLPVENLAAIDALCARGQMSRSQMLRQAAVYFAAYLDAPGVHHREVHDEADFARVAREVRALRVEIAELRAALQEPR